MNLRVWIWRAFSTFVLGLSIWFCVGLVSDLLYYKKLQGQTEATLESVEVVAIGKDAYARRATFSFQVEGALLKGSAFLKGAYPNSYAAAARSYSPGQKETVYYSTKDPTIVSFTRPFPWKKSLSTMIVFGIGIYFFILDRYVRAKESSH